MNRKKIAILWYFTFSHTQPTHFQSNSKCRSITCCNEDLQYFHVILIKVTYIFKTPFWGVEINAFVKNIYKKKKKKLTEKFYLSDMKSAWLYYFGGILVKSSKMVNLCWETPNQLDPTIRNRNFLRHCYLLTISTRLRNACTL